MLALAHDENCETELAALVAKALDDGQLPDDRQLRDRLKGHQRDLPSDVPVTLTALASFDTLLGAGA